jgi:hypothetical protein
LDFPDFLFGFPNFCLDFSLAQFKERVGFLFFFGKGNLNKNPGTLNKKSRNPSKKRIEFLCLDFCVLFKKCKFNYSVGKHKGLY